MSVGDSTILSVALFMRAVAIIMCVLGAEAPATRLPKRTFFFDVIGTQLVAFEAIGELGFASSTPLA